MRIPVGDFTIHVFVVEDNERWRSFLIMALRERPELRVVGEACDGLEAVQKAAELQPDLILLDLGLPALNGMEVARRIRETSPASKILFVTENSSAEIVTAALRTGAVGYVLKSDAGRELLPAVEAVLKGERFVSASLLGQLSGVTIGNHDAAITYSHEVAFYSDDISLVDGYARFIASSLNSANAIVVIVTEPHRADLIPRLEASGLNVPAAIEQGRYIALDAANAISNLTVNDMPDSARCTKVINDLIMRAAKGIRGTNGRVAVCGEIAPTLLSKGNVEGAIKLESLWDEITRGYGVHTLCGYLSSAFPHHEADLVFQRICAEHSGIYDRRLGC